MKKSILIIFLVCLGLLSCMLTFTACDADENKQTPNINPDTHTHEFGQWTTVKEPTCVQKGEQKRVCSCGEKETQSINMVAHAEVTDEAVAPTCTKTGLTEGKHCSVCSEVLLEQQTVDIIPHNYYNGTCTLCGGNQSAFNECFIFTELNDGTYSIKANYDKEWPVLSGTVIIPSTYNGTAVTEIAPGAFSELSVITDVIIPDSVISIEENAFSFCFGLKNIIIPDSVTSIGDNAFYWCTNLAGITIPDGVTYIGNSVFSGCSDLTSVTIPNSVASIGYGAFENCLSLKEIYYAGSLSQWYSINKDSTWNTNTGAYTVKYAVEDSYVPTPNEYFKFTALLDGTYSISAEDVNNMPTDVVIPYEYKGRPVTAIGDDAFSECANLASVTISNIVTSIGDNAFYWCTNLTSITIPDSVTSIGDYVFGGCTNLTSIILSDSVTSIGECSFVDCTNLTSITIPDSVTSIGDDAFGDCTRLTSIMIGNSVTSIGIWAFRGCTSLTSITIPDSVKSIRASAFVGCTSLANILVNAKNQTYRSENNCIIFKNTNRLILGCKNSIIPDDITSIADYAFYGCTSLTSITIPDSVTSIGVEVFYGCTSLTSITIPDSLTSIGRGAFENCTSLTSAIIGNGITSIDENTFKDCASLASITIPDSTTSIGRGAFENCTSLASITIGNSVESI